MDDTSQIQFDFMDPGSQKEAAAKKSAQVVSVVRKEPAVVQKEKSTRGRKSLKSFDTQVVFLDVPDDDILFKKSYYSIGDVAEMFRVNASLIRYWENEFDILKPKKNAKGDRHFRPEDVKNLKLIHHLLRERKYTMEGAKEFLRNNKSASQKFELIKSLEKLKFFLLELKTSL